MKITKFLIAVILLFTTIINAQIKFNKNIPNEAHQKITQNLSNGISCFTFSPIGGWVLITNNNKFYQVGIPDDAHRFLKHFKKTGHKLKQISFAHKIPKGTYGNYNAHVIITDRGAYGVNIPGELKNKISDFQRRKKKIKNISFPFVANSTNAWVIITEDGDFASKNIPDNLYKYLVRAKKSSATTGKKITQVSFTPSGGWVILTDGYYFAKGIPSDAYQKIVSFHKKKYNSNNITFTPNGIGWSLIANGKFYTSYKLKVTLDYFYCDESDDSDEKDDYIFNQWVVYTDKQNKKIQKIDSKMIINNSSQIDIKKRTLDGRYISGTNIIIKGDTKHQFWVKEGTRKKIGNYITFEISEKLLNDSNSRFIIYSSLVEKSDSKGGFLTIGTAPGSGINMSSYSKERMIDIKKVITDLKKIKTVQHGKWNYYGDMKIRKHNTNSIDLYGYLNFSDKDNDRKAKAMMRFKLLD